MLSRITKGLLCGPVLFFCTVLLCVESSAAPTGTPLKDLRWVEKFQQAHTAISGKTEFNVTPSASFLTLGSTTLYTPGINLEQRLKHSVMAAGSEIAHSSLQIAMLSIAALIDPTISVFNVVSRGLSIYRFVRFWLSRGILLHRVGSFLQDQLFPEYHLIDIDLSSQLSGVVAGKLQIPFDNDAPVTLDIYLNRGGNNLLEECRDNFSLDCLLLKLRSLGTYQWRMQWHSASGQIHHQVFHEDQGESIWEFYTAINSAWQVDNNNELHFSAWLLGMFLSEHTLRSIHHQLRQEAFSGTELATIPWYGESSAFIHLGCSGNGSIDGLYLNASQNGEHHFVSRVQLSEGEDLATLLDALDSIEVRGVLNPVKKVIRIPAEAVTVIFEVLEEILEELGNRGVTYVSDQYRSSIESFTEQHDSGSADIDSPLINSNDGIDDPDSDTSAAALYALISDTEQEHDPDVIYDLAGYVHGDDVIRVFEKTLEMGREHYIASLIEYVPSDWFDRNREKLVRTPIWLKQMLSYLPEQYIEEIMIEAANLRLLETVRLLRPIVDVDLLNHALSVSASRGGAEVVSLLLPGRNIDAIVAALNSAHQAGWGATVDLLIGALPEGDYQGQVPMAVFKGAFIRAVEADNRLRVLTIMSKIPSDMIDDLPRWAAKYGNPQLREMVLDDDRASVVFKRAVNALDSGEFKKTRDLAMVLPSAEKLWLLDHAIRKNKRRESRKLFDLMPEPQKVAWLMQQAKIEQETTFEDFMVMSDPVISDQVLLESVRSGADIKILDRIAASCHQISIQRAAMLARKTGLNKHAIQLHKRFEHLDDMQKLTPAPRLSSLQKKPQKEAIRELRNKKLGRAHLGESFYVYQEKGVQARRAYVISHGSEPVGQPPFQHKGSFVVSFIAPDGHMHRNNHIALLLERNFRAKEQFKPGSVIKQYSLQKSHNSGAAFLNLSGRIKSDFDRLMIRKATPYVLSGLRQNYAKHGELVDIITVRGKGAVTTKTLINELRDSPVHHYEEVIFGCCRARPDKIKVYDSSNVFSRQSLNQWKHLFMRIYHPLKLHSALIDTPYGEYYHPMTKNPEGFIKALERYGDPVAVGAVKFLKQETTRIKGYHRRK